MSVLWASKLPLLSRVSAREFWGRNEDNSRLLLHRNKVNFSCQATPRYSKAGSALPSNADL